MRREKTPITGTRLRIRPKKPSHLSTKALVILSIAWLLLSSVPAHAGIIYVDASATGANNGSSWVDAYVDLQVALGAAVSGDSIWVVAGTYFPAPSYDPSATFQLRNGVALYGGFAGTETSLSERDVLGNLTVLGGRRR